MQKFADKNHAATIWLNVDCCIQKERQRLHSLSALRNHSQDYWRSRNLSVPYFLPENTDDMMGPDEDLSNVVIEEDEAQNELHGVLAKARKLKLKKERNRAPEVGNM